MITISLEEEKDKEKEWQSRRKEAKEFLKERENEEYFNRGIRLTQVTTIYCDYSI